MFSSEVLSVKLTDPEYEIDGFSSSCSFKQIQLDDKHFLVLFAYVLYILFIFINRVLFTNKYGD